MSMRRNKRRQMAEINVVPYIDVMLVLLIIFMITAPLLSQGVKVKLPQASAKALSAKQPEPIIVSVDVKGNYYLNIATDPHVPITTTELQRKITTMLQSNSQQRQILVKGDRNVNYGKVVQAMVLLQQAGATNIGLMTETPASNKSQ